jgi:hypothetical protein
MTGSLTQACPHAGTSALMSACPATATTQRSGTPDFSAPNILADQTPASRPSGRYAVTLRVNLDPDALTGMPAPDANKAQP